MDKVSAVPGSVGADCTNDPNAMDVSERHVSRYEDALRNAYDVDRLIGEHTDSEGRIYSYALGEHLGKLVESDPDNNAAVDAAREVLGRMRGLQSEGPFTSGFLAVSSCEGRRPLHVTTNCKARALINELHAIVTSKKMEPASRGCPKTSP